MRRKRLPSLKERSEAMKKRLAAKKEKIMAKLKGARPGDAIIELVAVVGVALGLAVMGLCCCGCALERSDPAARSNRATITLTVTAHGDGSTATGYITDGLLATADGEGAITQPSTQTTEQSPDLTVPGDALSAGITAAAHIGGKAIDAYSASKTELKSSEVEKLKSPSGLSTSQPFNLSTGDSPCADGNCSDSPCLDGNCTPTAEVQ